MNLFIKKIIQKFRKCLPCCFAKEEPLKKPVSFLIQTHKNSSAELQASHAGNLGDILFGCLFLKGYWQSTGRKVRLHLQTHVPTEYSVEHPLKNIHMDTQGAEQLVPLLKMQPYLSEITFGRSQPDHIDFDLNIFRKLPINLCSGLIQGWQQLCTDVWLNVFDPWIEAEILPDYRDTIIVSRTARLRSDYISYDFLRDFSDRLLFIGLPEECERFKQETKIDCPSLTVDNFYYLACLIRSCLLFVGNQGFLYTIAESVKCPRVLESNTIAPNNYPMSPNGRIALFQNSFENFVRSMIKNSA